ncbi:MAG: serine/threonine protein kinase, partial [Gemmataceae bacterium]
MHDEPDTTRPADSHARPTDSGRRTLAIPGYLLHDEIERGGMGAILRATDVSLERTVAIKRLHTESLNSPEAIRRFLDEARITARLQHPGIPPIHAVGTAADGT